jgi:hypothetical protein
MYRDICATRSRRACSTPASVSTTYKAPPFMPILIDNALRPSQLASIKHLPTAKPTTVCDVTGAALARGSTQCHIAEYGPTITCPKAEF